MEFLIYLIIFRDGQDWQIRTCKGAKSAPHLQPHPDQTWAMTVLSWKVPLGWAGASQAIDSPREVEGASEVHSPHLLWQHVAWKPLLSKVGKARTKLRPRFPPPSHLATATAISMCFQGLGVHVDDGGGESKVAAKAEFWLDLLPACSPRCSHNLWAWDHMEMVKEWAGVYPTCLLHRHCLHETGSTRR